MNSQTNRPLIGDDSPVEVRLTSATRRKLQQCYQRGKALVSDESYDYEYAHAMFAECVRRDPGNHVYIDALLDNLRRKYHNNKKGRLLKSPLGHGRFKKLMNQHDWKGALNLAPDELKRNPWDVALLRGLADACEHLEYHDAALLYLRFALSARPQDIELNRHCARVLATVGNFEKAVECLQRVIDKRPNDVDASKMISIFTVEQQRLRSSFSKDELEELGVADKMFSKPDDLKPRRVATAREPDDEQASGKQDTGKASASAEEPTSRREIKLTPRQELEQAIQFNPVDTESYLKLAQLLSDEGRFADAEQTLQKALSVAGKDERVQQLLEQAMIRRARQQVEIARQRAEIEGTPGSQQLQVEMQASLDRLELEIFDRRAQQDPQNLELKYEVGLRLKRLGNLTEAVNHLNAARRSETCGAAARVQLGECLQHVKRFADALRSYQKGIEMARECGDEESLRLGLYRAGVLAAGLSQFEAAEAHLNELVLSHPTYKDSLARLDKIRQMAHKG